MMLSQFRDRRHFLFTYLEDYKQNPTFARPNVAVTLHDDLAEEKGIVLLRADLESLLTKRESEHLVEQLIQTYLVSPHFAHSPKAIAVGRLEIYGAHRPPCLQQEPPDFRPRSVRPQLSAPCAVINLE